MPKRLPRSRPVPQQLSPSDSQTQQIGPPVTSALLPSSAREVTDPAGSSSPPSVIQSTPPGFAPLNPQDPPKTPVCIGQFATNALVLQHIDYLNSRDSTQGFEWAPVRLIHEHRAVGSLSADIIHIRSLSEESPNGTMVPAENFAILEQQVADVLGGMILKGLIRLEAKVRGGVLKSPVIPVLVLVYTPKGNITVVGDYLRQCNLLLDHPSLPHDDPRLITYPYFNPHNPPPAEHPRPSTITDRGLTQHKVKKRSSESGVRKTRSTRTTRLQKRNIEDENELRFSRAG